MEMNAKQKMMLDHYRKYRVPAAEALDVLKAKNLADGSRYYIGFNKRDGWLEVFRSDIPLKPGQELNAEQIDAYLEENGLYLFMSRAGWVTIRKLPLGWDSEVDED